MPNWCMNELEVEAPDSEQLQKFIYKMASAAQDDEVLSFQSILPMPEILEDTISPAVTLENVLKCIQQDTGKNLSIEDFEEKYKHEYPNVHQKIKQYRLNNLAKEETGYSDWYSWQHDKWGVKWGCQNSTVDVYESNKCLYCYDTPWGSAIGWLLYLSKMYPEFKFNNSCCDPSMDFHTEYSLSGGYLIEETNMTFREAVVLGYWGGEEMWEEEE